MSVPNVDGILIRVVITGVKSYVCRDIIVSKFVFIGNHASLGNGLSISEQICLILELKPYSKATSLYRNNTTPMKQLHLPSGCHYMHEDAPYYVVITHHDRTSTCTIGLPLNLLIKIKLAFEVAFYGVWMALVIMKRWY